MNVVEKQVGEVTGGLAVKGFLGKHDALKCKAVVALLF